MQRRSVFEGLRGCFGLVVVVVVVTGRPAIHDGGGAAASPSLYGDIPEASQSNGDSADQRACAVDDDESLCSAGMGLARNLWAKEGQWALGR